MSRVIKVRIADYGVLKDEGHLMTIGLGSCVGIALYDPFSKVAGLAHILLPDSRMFIKKENLAKFADTAIPLLLSAMKNAGANRSSIEARIAGGSSLFEHTSAELSIGKRNSESVLRVLADLKIRIAGSDLGGKRGRTMQVCAATGNVTVVPVGGASIQI
jgi:chemotaxis protein CheD